MSDIGLFSTADLLLLALIGCSPGLVLGAALGAWIGRGRRLLGAAAGGTGGFALAFALWWIYLTILK